MSKSMEKRLRVQVPRIAELEAEVERLRAYLPLARAAVLMAHDNPMPLSRDCGCPRCVAYWRTTALTPDERAWLMEGE